MADLFTLIGIVPIEQRKVLGGDQKYTANINGMYTKGAKTLGKPVPTHAVYGNPGVMSKGGSMK